MVVMLMPVFMLLVPLMLMPMAVLAGFFVVVMMVFVYHSFRFFLAAKLPCPACNRVAIVMGIG